MTGLEDKRRTAARRIGLQVSAEWRAEKIQVCRESACLELQATSEHLLLVCQHRQVRGLRAVDLLDTGTGPEREIDQIATLAIREPHSESAAGDADESIQIDFTSQQNPASVGHGLTQPPLRVSGRLTDVRGRRDQRQVPR